MTSSRRLWGSKSDLAAEVARDNAAEAHEEYLLLLQQRNRLLAKLKEKDEKQLELERKEQGFSLYLNGANVGLQMSGQRNSRLSKTAGEGLKREVFKSEVSGLRGIRAKTAPTKPNRKGWHHTPVDTIHIKTQFGDKLKVGVPSVYSGKYSQDFESLDIAKSKILESDFEMREDGLDDTEQGHDTFVLSDDDSEISEYENDHELTFTVHDVKVLRASLENDSTIRQSIASISDDLPTINSEDETSQPNFEQDEYEDDIPEEVIPDYADEDDVLFTPRVDNVENEIPELSLISTSRSKSRPISATRKQSDSSVVDHIEPENISAAIAEENRMLADYQLRRKTKTAPVSLLQEDFEMVDDTEDRPATSHSLSDKEIFSITQRVRSLSGRQQKKLLQMLGDIDLAGEDILNNSWDTRKDTNKQYLAVEKNNRSAISPTPVTSPTQEWSTTNSTPNEGEKFDSNMNLKLSSNTTVSSDDSELQLLSPQKSQYSYSGKCVEVVLDLHSNWGNEKYIGLTEAQFFDSTNKLIKVLPEDLHISGSNFDSADLKNICNSKTKTTKEKFMWKCPYCLGEDIKIVVLVKGCDAETLGKIVLWNFNKNLQELNIGVKNITVLVDREMKWEGVIEKGCGNQIFDYSTTIPINIPVSPSTPAGESESSNFTKPYASSKCPTVSENQVCSDIMADSLLSETKMTNQIPGSCISMHGPASSATDNKLIPEEIGTSVSGVCHKTESNVLNLLDDLSSSVIEPSACSSPDLSKKRTSGSNTSVGNKSKKPKDTVQSSRSSSSMSDKPIWFEDMSSKVKEDLYLEGKKVSLNSARRSYQNSPDIMEEPTKRRPISGRRSQQQQTPQPTPSPDTDLKLKKESEDVFDLDSLSKQGPSRRELRNRNDSKKSQQGKNTTSYSSSTNISYTKTERAKFKETMDKNFEISMQSISNFNSRHLGRIRGQMDDDDNLRSLLQPMKAEDILELQGKSITPNPELKKEQDKVDDADAVTNAIFELPVLPQGKDLIINIKSTWGDRHYVGLNGVEVFSKSGHLVKIKNINADPSDINVLPEFDDDPRVVTNLIDRCYLTRDDLHLWLTPFTHGGDHFVELEFEEEIEVAMIRIWNYNKSRIHSSRGARFVEMALDGKLIFIGEIARASGVLSKEDPYGDTILFTTDEDILTLVATNDFTYEVEMDEEEDCLIASGIFAERPKTADKTTGEPNERPFTCPKSRESTRAAESPMTSECMSTSDDEDGFIQCKSLTIFFCETWGDQHYLGLTGLEVLGETFEKIPLDMQMLTAQPEDLNVLEEYDDDDRTLDKIINHINVTTCDENMWMIPFDENETHMLKITFSEYTIVTGLRIWNYNKSMEDTFRGAKTIHVYLDDHVISPENGFLLRKGPGHCHFDYAQDILFNDPESPFSQQQYPEASKHRKINLQKIVNEYETIMMPSGFVFQFKLLSSWADQYYIGLNGIEVYDKTGEKIELSDNNITAYPHSVNVLDGVSDDVRTPDKLVNNVNDTYDGRMMWLAPILPGQINNIYIVFDKPITISMIKIWNYYKTPTRGVRNFGLLVDDLLVYSGVLPQHDAHTRGIAPGLNPPGAHHTILFTDNEEIALKERKHVLSSRIYATEQNVQLTNDRAVLNPFKNEKEKTVEADPSMRPMTSVTSMKGGRDRR